MPRTQKNPPPRNAPKRRRPQPRVAVAHIDLAITYAVALEDHISANNAPANKLLVLLHRSLDQATAALAFEPKPKPKHPQQTQLTG